MVTTSSTATLTTERLYQSLRYAAGGRPSQVAMLQPGAKDVQSCNSPEPGVSGLSRPGQLGGSRERGEPAALLPAPPLLASETNIVRRLTKLPENDKTRIVFAFEKVSDNLVPCAEHNGLFPWPEKYEDSWVLALDEKTMDILPVEALDTRVFDQRKKLLGNARADCRRVREPITEPGPVPDP